MNEERQERGVKVRTSTIIETLGLAWLTLGFQTAYAEVSDIRPEVPIRIEGAPSMGVSSAKVTMIEFSDYQCPRSGEYFGWTMGEIVKVYVNTGKVKYVYRDFPIESIHPLAMKAAEGAHCAGEQGKYWEMRGRYFRNQASIGPAILPLHAQMLGLDVRKFRECLDNGKYIAKIGESVEDGKKAGVLGTPWFFLGLTDPNLPLIRASKYVNGRQPFAVFKEAIEELLSLPGESGNKRPDR